MEGSHGSAFERMVWRVLLGLLVAYLIGFAVFVTELPGRPPAGVHADAIVALTGGEERLDTAVALFEHGVGKRLLITGVYANMTKGRLQPMLHGGRRFDCCADLGFTATNTHGNAMETARWVRAHHFQSLVVVTANYHMPRSLTEFSAAMPGVRLVAYPVPEIVAARHWWLDPARVKTLQYEYAKYLGSVALTAVYPGHWKDNAGQTRTSAL
ncbi:MAG TPA: YdcF family protein [Rhizomicrobium sp.]|nr:YdcF family protein [Rhizomicrobium sp.]